MTKKSLLNLLLLIGALITLPYCGGGGGGGPVNTPTLASIAVTPANPSTVMGTTKNFTAMGTYSDNSTKDLTTAVTWVSSATGVATISNAGVATPVTAGTTTITATQGSISGMTTLTVAQLQPTTAVVTLSTAVTGAIPPTTTINGYDVTITLPAGVTVKASPDSVNPAILVTDPNVVTAVGSASGSTIDAVYTAAAGGLPATVKVHVISASGFSAGDFCTITCDIATGSNPLASDFAQPTLEDATGLDASVSTVNLTGVLSLTETAVIH